MVVEFGVVGTCKMFIQLNSTFSYSHVAVMHVNKVNEVWGRTAYKFIICIMLKYTGPCYVLCYIVYMTNNSRVERGIVIL